MLLLLTVCPLLLCTSDSPREDAADATTYAKHVCHFRLLRGDPKGSVAAGNVKVVCRKTVAIDRRSVKLLDGSEGQFGFELTVWFGEKSQTPLRANQTYIDITIIERGGGIASITGSGQVLTNNRAYTEVIRNNAMKGIEKRYLGDLKRDYPFLEDIHEPLTNDALWIEITLENP